MCEIEMLYKKFSNQARLSFGWGTMLTNDFIGLSEEPESSPISLVCKAVSVNGKPTVKISDDRGKILGRAEDLDRYMRVFN